MRLTYLDSTRGIAAIVVVIFHLMIRIDRHIFSHGTWLYTERIIFNGRFAVTYFFILSGLVLSLKIYQQKKFENFDTFTIKRIFRLYPLYIVCVSAMLFLKWFGWKQYLSELTIVTNEHRLLGTGWTMTVELIYSFLVPVIAVFTIDKPFRFIPLIFISLFGTFYLGPFFFHFVCGIFLAFLLINNRLKVSSWWLLPAVIFFAIGSIDTFPIIRRLGDQLTNDLGLADKATFTIPFAISGTIIIGFILVNERIQKLLNQPFFLFLGKISYSIYLTHLIILDASIPIFQYFAKFGVFFAHLVSIVYALLATLIVSTLTYYIIEEPFIKYGNKIAYSARFRKRMSRLYK